MSACASRRLRGALRRLDAAALALLTLTTPGLLVARSIEMSGATFGAVPRVVALVVLRTDFGHLWMVRIVGLATLWLLWYLRACAPRSGARHEPVHGAVHDWLSLVAMAVVAFTRSASGHAGDHGDLRAAVWVDWLHLVGAGLWGGLIVAFVVAVRPELRRTGFPGAAGIIARFSTLAGIGLLLVAASGIFNAWRVLGAWTPLWNSRYGLILDGKIGAFLVMALLGAVNRFRNVPAIRAMRQDSRALDALLLTSALEALLFVAILAAAAMLLQGAPPSANG